LIDFYNWTAFCSHGTWYAKAHIGNKTVLMHRVITMALKEQKIDHINGNGLDNRKENLRLATNRQNSWNSKSTIGSSKYKGVSWCKQKNKWRTRIYFNGKDIHLGFFVNEKDAAKIYDEIALKYFGEFARINFYG
jgi:hypothetical protein